MKKSINHYIIISALALGSMFAGAFQAYSQITVKVDSTKPWQGYMNVSQTEANGSGYVFGSGWGIPDLRAAFIPTNSPSGWPLNTDLVLKPNTGTYNTNDVFWNAPDGAPNKVLEANFYIDVGTAYAGQTVTFEGTVTTNTIPSPTAGPSTGWQTVAFVKEFTAPNYGFVGITSVPLTPGAPFSVARAIFAGNICQYGFYVLGPNTAPDSANAMTGVGILVQDSDPAITTQPVGATITTGTSANLSVVAIGSSALSYQWKHDNTNVLNAGNISGANSPTLTIANAQLANSGPYFVTVSDTAGSVDSATVQVNVLDILISTPPVSQRVEQDSAVVFSITASSSSALTYQWKSVIGGVTNNLSNGVNVSGATSNVLTLANIQLSQSGTYLVTVSTGAQSANSGATLLVKNYADYANFLENPGFENDPTGVNESPWLRYESTDPSFGSFQDASDTYFGGGNVNVYQGTYVSFTTFNAEYSGIYQDVIAKPGQIFAASMWFYNASGDPLPGPPPAIDNGSNLEIQFRSSSVGTPIQQYVSATMNYATPQNVWFNLQGTNAGGYGTMPPTANAKYLVAPPGTTMVRFQVTLHNIAGSIGVGSLYYDSAALMLKVPVTISASQQGSNIVLAWKSQGATSYQLQYKDGLSDVWHDLEVVAGTGLVVSKSYPDAGAPRFYRVLTL